MSQPKMKVDPNGTKEWFLNDVLHREDGPAIETPDGAKLWYFHGNLHREDGPAVEWPNGTKFWYLNDEKVTWEQVFRNANGDLEKECRILVAALTTS